MTTTLITDNFKSFSASQIVESITEASNTSYYLFLGNPTPYTGGDTNVPAPTNSVKDIDLDAYADMVAGKRITSSDVAHMVRRINWASGTVYDQYDDTTDLSSKNFYVVTNTGGMYYVFKCLFNNYGAASTVEPNFNDTSAEDSYFSTSDGYSWKYLYSLEKSVFEKFATADYMPVVADSAVSGNASAGSIETILVTTGGQFYNNYYYGKFNLDDLKIGGDERKFNIGKDASSVSGYYYNSFIYIVEGTGKGQYKRISAYDVSLTTKQITVESKFDIDLDATSRYEITPWVVVNGNGTQTGNCVARALVNSASSNSIYKIEVLTPGAGFLSANAKVMVSSNVGVTNTATLRAVLPPAGGHGFNPIKELYSPVLGISIKFANTEGSTISTENDYRTIGILKDPLFANVVVSVVREDNSAGTDGTFLDEEEVLQIVQYKLAGNVSVTSTSNTVTGTGTVFENSFEVGDRILIKAGTSNFVGNVYSITSNTVLNLTSNCSFSNTAAEVYRIKVTATANVESRATGSLTLTNVSGILTNESKLIGTSSYASANISSYEINDVTKNFNTFNQMTKLYYDTNTGTFAEDELIFQTSELGTGIGDDTSAIYHSIDTSNKIVYVTNKYGIFNANTATGNSSGATINITSVLPGDLVPSSGEVLYLEYLEPIIRSNTQSETIKILVEY